MVSSIIIFLVGVLSVIALPLLLKAAIYLYGCVLYVIGEAQEKVMLSQASPEVRREYLERQKLGKELKSIADDYARFL